MNFYKRLYKLFDIELKKNLVYLQILFLIGAVFQLLSVFAMASFITALTSIDSLDSSKILLYLYEKSGADSTSSFMIILGISVSVVIIVSNSFLAFMTWASYSFSMKIGSFLQSQIFIKYLNQNFLFFSQQNSSVLISVITNEVPRLVYMAIQPMMIIVSQIISIIFIIGALVLTDPMVAITSFLVISSLYFFIYSSIRERVYKNGREISELNEGRQRILTETIQGIKDVKLRHLETWRAEEFTTLIRKMMGHMAFNGISADLPRFIVEAIVFTSTIGLSIYLFISFEKTSEAIAVLSLYAVAGYKILPLAQATYRDLSNIKANSSVLGTCEYYLSMSNSTDDKSNGISGDKYPIICNEDIEFRNVSFRYPNQNSNAVENLSFKIRKNKINTFVGKSGSGKSTALDILLGLLKPEKGEVLIGKTQLGIENIEEWQRNIGYVPQDIQLLDSTWERNIAYGIPLVLISKDKVDNALKMSNLYDYVKSLPDGIQSRIGENGCLLSGGQRQRLAVARALYHNPTLIILDEATSSLDSANELKILDMLASLKKEKTIIMIAHRESSIRASDHVIQLEDGKLSN